MSTYYVPGTVLGSGEQQGTKQMEISVPVGLTFWRGETHRQDKISQLYSILEDDSALEKQNMERGWRRGADRSEGNKNSVMWSEGSLALRK